MKLTIFLILSPKNEVSDLDNIDKRHIKDMMNFETIELKILSVSHPITDYILNILIYTDYI